jgi:Family of unknown function (DUF6152)
MKKPFVLAAVLVVASSVNALAHHAFSAVYDDKKPMTLKGKVTKVEWMNPHIHFYIDVTDQSGKVTNWAVEGATPNQLYRRGWRRDSLKVGEIVTVDGFRSRTPTHFAVNARTVMLTDGRKLFSGSNDGGPDRTPGTR